MSLTFWLVVAAIIALIGVGLFVCAIYAGAEPVRKCGLLDFTGAKPDSVYRRRR